MPWSAEDVARFNKRAAGDAHLRSVWLAAANRAMGACMRKMGSKAKCEASAIRIANAAVSGGGRTKEETEGWVVRSVVFSKARFTLKEARKWATAAGYGCAIVSESPNCISLHQRPLSEFGAGTSIRQFGVPSVWLVMAPLNTPVREEALVERSALTEITTGDVTGRIDRNRFVIADVAVLGTVSRNGRTYPPAVIKEALPMFETRVFANHLSDPKTPRDVRDMVGRLAEARQLPDGRAIANLHVSKTHAWVLDLAEVAGDLFGLSINGDGDLKRAKRPALDEVLKITSVSSVDVVSTPGANKGLFEGAQS